MSSIQYRREHAHTYFIHTFALYLCRDADTDTQETYAHAHRHIGRKIDKQTHALKKTDPS